MTEEFIKKCLDYDGWIVYQKGSEKFKESVKMGLRLQYIEMELALDKLNRVTK